jgi:hypothetical protein
MEKQFMLMEMQAGYVQYTLFYSELSLALLLNKQKTVRNYPDRSDE